MKSISRRQFLGTAGIGAAALVAGCSRQQDGARSVAPAVNKREIMLSLLDDAPVGNYVPAAFFLHFDPIYHKGPAAVEKHLEYFRFTGMDFVKIQYENGFPVREDINGPKDWANMPMYAAEFYEGQLGVVKGLVEEAKEEALIIQTLYSPFMCAQDTLGGTDFMTEHVKEDPEAVKQGLEIVTESLLGFVRECARIGVDGFYASTQGGEAHRFAGTTLFEEIVKPFDLILMEECKHLCEFNILHICDYFGDYDDLSPFLDYPGDVVTASLKIGDEKWSPTDVYELFSRPYMGGVDKRGTIVSGSETEIREMVSGLLSEAPERYVLGADCTLPSDIDWRNIQVTIETAHG